MSAHTSNKTIQRNRRHARIRAKISGTPSRPRLALFRSNTALYAQIIDDTAARTLAAIDTRAQTGSTLKERATHAGTAIAAQAKKVGITNVVFDRGGMRYTGNVAAFAEAAREAGLVF
jgi:large subunit ribosomal protein L18